MPLSPRVSDLTNFELLLSVAELGSIGRAARAHGMSQPAASVRLRQLETMVGVPLLTRGARGAQLTTAGHLVVTWAQPVVKGAADLDAGIAAVQAQRDSKVRISASMTVAEYLMPRWLIALRGVDPHTVAALTSGNSTEVAAQVLAGEVDIGFIEGPRVAEGLQSRDVARDELVLVVAPSHSWAKRRRRPDAAEVATTPLVSREQGSGTRDAWEQALREHVDGDFAAPVLEVSSTTAIKAAAVGGIGPAVLSVRAVKTELAEGTLVRVTVPNLDLSRLLRAVWPAGQTLRGPARDLLAIALRAGAD